MKRLKSILSSLAIVIILVSLALLINFHTPRIGLNSLPQDFETVSPDRTYTVRLKEQRENHIIPFSNIDDPPGCPAEFSVYKKGQPVIEKMDIGDDSNLFDDLYPDHSWVADSILRFGNKDPDELGHDEVVVRNNSNQVIAYLQVRTCKWEMFWLFDVQPNSMVKLSACPQIIWLDFYGKFSGGKNIPFVGMNFKIGSKRRTTGHYLITIADEGTSIDSPDFEGYN